MGTPIHPTEALLLHAPPPSTVGRAHEIEFLTITLRDPATRLVSLVGPPGAGKTHLARTVARRRLLGGTLDPVFVPLATLSGEDQLLPAIAVALGAQPSSSIVTADDLIAQIDRLTNGKLILIVLDGFEHLPNVAGALVSRLLERCSTIRLLVTSRVPLGVPVETCLPIDTLVQPVASSLAQTGAAALAESPAAQLLWQRARAVNPRFDYSDAEAPQVAAILERVSGLPLAIELVASRLRTMTIRDLAGSLVASPDDSLDALLASVVRWSYDRLDPEDQRVFRFLAVFQDQFDRDRVAIVADRSPSVVATALSHLAEAGLISLASYGGVMPRFHLHDLPRDVARRLLVAHGEYDASMERQHSWFRDLAVRADFEAFHADQDAGFRALDAANADLEAVFAWLDAAGRHDELVELAVGCRFYWLVQVRYVAGLAVLDRAFAVASPELKGKIALGIGVIQFYQGNFQVAGDTLDVARPLLERHGDARDRGMLDLIRSAVHFHLGDVQIAMDLHITALEHARKFTPAFGKGMEMLCQADLAFALALFGPPPHAGHVMAIDDAIDRLRAASLTWVMAMVIPLRAALALRDGDFETTASLLREQLALTYTHHLDRRTAAEALAGLALVAISRDQPERATRILGAHDLIVDQIGGSILFSMQQFVPLAAIRAQAHTMLGEQRYQRLLADGRALNQDGILRLAESVLTEWPVVVAGFWTAGDSLPSGPPKLGTEDLDVLELLMVGLSDKEIAQTLSISLRMATYRVQIIRKQTGTNARGPAAHYGRVRGVSGWVDRTL